MDNVRFVAAGYLLTAVALGGYAAWLFRRAAKARERVHRISAARRDR